MAIIISQDHKNAQKVEKSEFKQEDFLQEYIYNNPESLPLYEINENTRLLIVSREFPTTSGPIDAIGFDADGEIYIIETKLYKNPDERKVVAQILDYGAALSFGYGDFSEFLRILENKASKHFSMSLEQKLQQFFSKDAVEVITLLESVKTNFSDGKFKFLVLMDRLEQRLKDLIMFISQNSTFNIYGIEMEYYEFQSYQIIIPKLFGVEVKKGTGISTSTKQKWNETSFFDAANDNLEEHRVASLRRLYDFFNFGDCKANKINWGTGKVGSFNVIYSRLSPYGLVIVHADGHLYFPFNPIGSPEEIRHHKDQLKQVVVDLGWSEYIRLTEGGGYARVPIDVWASELSDLIKNLRDFISSWK